MKKKIASQSNWTFTCIIMIYYHHIHNHIPIRITIVIYNSMHIARIRSWPNHPLYRGLVRNIWFSVCKPIQVFFSWTFFCRRCIVTTSRLRNFLFLNLLNRHLIPPPLIFLILESCVINKTLNPIIIIHSTQPSWWILIHA